MPYVDLETRHHLLNDGAMTESGHLNYIVSLVALKYLEANGLSYQTCNDIVGALDNAKHEFKRRVQDPYEDTKARDNGDIYQNVGLVEHPASVHEHHGDDEADVALS